MPPAAPAQLTLVCPPLTSENVEAALSSLVRRARTGPAVPERVRLLFSLFGIAPGTDPDLPAGAVSNLGDTGVRPEGYWLRADPVHLRATLRDVFLEPPSSLGLTPEEAAELAGDIDRHFRDRGWRLSAARPQRWYLSTPPLRLSTRPTHEVAGRNVDEYLPGGDDARAWRSDWTELQMFLHQHPVNHRREDEGRPTVNGLWVWGGGMLPRHASASWTRVWSDDPLALGLAALAGIPGSALPAATAALGTELQPGGAYLAVLDSEARTAAARHPLNDWLPLFHSGNALRVSLLAPGEPERVLSPPNKLLGRLRHLFAS